MYIPIIKTEPEMIREIPDMGSVGAKKKGDLFEHVKAQGCKRPYLNES